MRLPSAILFDLDGTLIDGYAAIALSLNHVRSHYDMPPLTLDEVRRVVGHGVLVTLGRVVPGIDPHEALRLYEDHHPRVIDQHTKLLPGVAEELPALRRLGCRLAVCSNKPVAFSRHLVTTLGIANEFEAVLGPEDVPLAKPAPDMLLEAMRRLESSPDRSLYFGDMTVDIHTARAAGVPVWVVTTGSDDRERLERAEPDLVLETLQGLSQRWVG